MDWVLIISGLLAATVLLLSVVFWFVFRPRELLHTVQMLTQQVRELSTEAARSRAELRELEERETAHRRKLEAEAAANRGEIRQVETRLYDAVRLISRLLEGISELTKQIEDEGGVPNFEVPTDAKLLLEQKPSSKPPNAERKLSHLFGSKFSEDELRSVCLDIGADYENLPGSMKEARAQSLVRWAAHRGQLEDLAKIGQGQRPSEDWSI